MSTPHTNDGTGDKAALLVAGHIKTRGDVSAAVQAIGLVRLVGRRDRRRGDALPRTEDFTVRSTAVHPTKLTETGTRSPSSTRSSRTSPPIPLSSHSASPRRCSLRYRQVRLPGHADSRGTGRRERRRSRSKRSSKSGLAVWTSGISAKWSDDHLRVSRWVVFLVLAVSKGMGGVGPNAWSKCPSARSTKEGQACRRGTA
jgi:hypothetical protein